MMRAIVDCIHRVTPPANHPVDTDDIAGFYSDRDRNFCGLFNDSITSQHINNKLNFESNDNNIWAFDFDYEDASGIGSTVHRMYIWKDGKDRLAFVGSREIIYTVFGFNSVKEG